MSNNLEIEVLKNKQDIALVTMAMGKVDDNLSTMNGTLKEMNVAIVAIQIAMASIESLERRMAKVEKEVDDIKDIPNKILFRVISTIAATAALGAIAYFGGKG